VAMSIKGYARSRHADLKAIRRAIAAGIIKRDADGKIDPEQADSSWGATRRASRLGQHQHDDAGTRSALGKVALAAAKLRLARQRFETARAKRAVLSPAVEIDSMDPGDVQALLESALDRYMRDERLAEHERDDEARRRKLQRFTSKYRRWKPSK
jgi:hypothetical protein